MKTLTRLWPASLLLAIAACQPPEPAPPPNPVAVEHSEAPLFNNGGFESGSFAPDWTVTTFLNTTGISNPPWPPVSNTTLNLVAGGNNLTSIVTNAVPESQLFAGMVAGAGVPMWPKFGTASAVINQQGNNQNANSLKQTYTVANADVDPSDGKVHVRFVLAPALQSAGHVQELQPYFFVALRNLTAPRNGDLYTSFNFSNSPGTPWQSQGSGPTAVLYTGWTVFDIAPGNVALQVGDSVQIEIYASGCQLGGHWGEVYVDGFGSSFPGLSITKTAPVQADIDTDFTYNFLVKNNTSGLAPNATADEVLPANTTFVSLSAPPSAVCTTPAVGATGTVTCNFGWMNPGASATFSVTVHAYTPATKGTATAATATTLTDSSKAWTVNGFLGWSVYVTSGTGSGQEREIRSNTATALTVSNAWSTTPDATSTYAVVNPPVVQGTATSGNGTSLTDNTKAFTNSQWSGWTLYIVGGQGAGQQRNITDNTATQLTVSPNWVTNPNNTSVYVIKKAPDIVNGNYGVKADTIARLLGQKVETTITGGVPFTDLAITKTDNVPAVVWGGPAHYTVTVVNNGPLAVTNALVTDTLPAQLVAGAPWTCVGGNGGVCNTASGTGNISNTVNLPVGGTATFTINATVVAGSGTGTLSNTASVAAPAGITDNVPINNADVDVDGIGTLFPLTLTKGPGAGQGTVTSSPAAINCGPGCATQAASFVGGTSVTLTAVARTGDTFAGWSGACSGNAMTCTISVSAATAVTANFTGLSVVGSAPGGNGTVTCVPSDVAQGGSSVCTIAPSAGYGLGNLTDNGVDVTASVSGNTYTLTNVTVNHSVVGTFGLLPVTPVITAPVNNSSTNNNRPPITGTTSPSTNVTVKVDGVTVCTTVSNAAGTFSCAPGSALTDGPHVATATATNGNGSATSAPDNFTVDTVAPAAPVVVTPANNSFTNNLRPPVTGTAEANSTVTVSIDGVVVGTAVTNASGNWTFTPPANLSQGVHTVSATATDAAGNVSPKSNTNSFTVDTVAPAAPVVVTPANNSFTNNLRPPVTGTAEANSTVTVSIDGVVVGTAVTNASGNWTFTPPANLSQGVHTVSATATDAAGNVSGVSNVNSFTVDTVAPAAPVVATPANNSFTNNPRPQVTGTAEANSTITVSIDGVVVGTAVTNASGNWTFTPPANLPQGVHSVSATATDAAGNVSGVSNVNSFTVDTVAPAAPVVVTPVNGSRTNNPRPVISGTAEANSTVTVSVDGMVLGTTVADASGNWSFTPSSNLADGLHSASATARDAAGNVSPTSNVSSFTIDTVAPAAPVVVTPANGTSTKNVRPPISGTAEANSTVTVSIDGAAVGTTVADASGNWTFTPTTNLADGPHTASATATDAAGNVSPKSNTNSFTVDTVAPAAPVVVAPANGSSTNSVRPPLSGTAEANSTVTVTLDGMVVGTTTADATGHWSLTPTSNLADGPHTVSATATDAAGNVSAPSNANTFTVDTVAPAAPVVVTPANGAITTPQPNITGTAEANSTVTVSVDGVVLGTAVTDATGHWSFVPSTALSVGSHTVSATATDAAGNVSGVSNVNTFTVNASPPPPPSVTAPADGSRTNDVHPPISGTAEANSTVTVSVDGQVVCTTTATASGTFSCTPATALSEGPHVVTAIATNGNGPSGVSAPITFTIDTTAPLTPVVVGPANGSHTGDTTPTVTGTGEPGSTVTVRIDGNAVGTATVKPDGSWSFDVPTALTLGSHTVSATETDAAGNVSLPSNTNTFSVDPPGAPVVTTPPDNSVVSSHTPLLGGTAPAGATVTVNVDGAFECTVTADASGHFSCSPSGPLADGVHTVDATVPDGAGGLLTSNTDTFTVDTKAPAAPVVLSPGDGTSTSNTRPPITGTAEPFSTVTVTVDGAVVGTAVADVNGVWSLVPSTALSLGSHTVSATATDRAGNASPKSNTNTFTVVAANGAPVVLTPVNGELTNDPTPTVSGTATPGASVEARVDGVVVCTATADASGAWSCTPTSPLSDGPHQATANVVGSSATSNANAFVVDTQAPAAPVVQHPADGSTTTATPTVSGTAEPGARVQVSIDGMPVCVALADAQGHWSCTAGTPLSSGQHTVNATATDAAGNVSPTSATNTFTVDAVAPAAPVLSSPADGSTSDNLKPSFSGTAEPGSQVTVYVDGEPVCVATADSSGAFSCTPSAALAPGAHHAYATASDAAGNVSPKSNTNAFTLTQTAPIITSPTPGSSVGTSTPSFTGTAPPGSTVVVSDGSTVLCTAVADANGNWSCTPTTPLPDGSHTVTATATVNGVTGPASASDTFTVDTQAPVVSISGGPGPQTSQRNASFQLSSNESGVTYTCSVDGGPFMPCSSQVDLTDLGPGKHTLDVKGTDAAGNVGTAHTEWVVQAGTFAGGGCGCNSGDETAVLGLALLLLWRRRRGARPLPCRSTAARG